MPVIRRGPDRRPTDARQRPNTVVMILRGREVRCESANVLIRAQPRRQTFSRATRAMTAGWRTFARGIDGGRCRCRARAGDAGTGRDLCRGRRGGPRPGAGGLGGDSTRTARRVAEKPADSRQHLAVVTVFHVDGVGTGADVLLQLRLPPGHPGPEVSVGAGPARPRGVGRDLGRHWSADPAGAVHRTSDLGCRPIAIPRTVGLPGRDVPTRSPTARCATTSGTSSACCTWSARTPTG